MKKQRVSVYIDGFNLYHAIDDLNDPKNPKWNHLKWTDLWAVSESLLRPYQKLTAVNYYSAYAKWLPGAFTRHIQYTKALRSVGVRIVMGEFKERRKGCKVCGARWIKHEEKESDVRIATDLVADAILDKFDDAFLITADSDLRPAVERVRAEAPKKNVIVVAPPKRYARARALAPHMEVTRGRIAKYLLPEEIKNSTGKVIAKRPIAYDPPK